MDGLKYPPGHLSRIPLQSLLAASQTPSLHKHSPFLSLFLPLLIHLQFGSFSSHPFHSHHFSFELLPPSSSLSQVCDNQLTLTPFFFLFSMFHFDSFVTDLQRHVLEVFHNSRKQNEEYIHTNPIRS